MLTVLIEGQEFYDEDENEFSSIGDVELEMEHSLISLSKWESKHQKPFLAKDTKTTEETYDYLKFMIVTPGIDRDVVHKCSRKNIEMIQSYIDSSQSATTFGIMPENRGQGEVITSELIYYWMVAFTIPWEAETWHLNRLFSLIRICNIKNSKPKKMSHADLSIRNRELNAKRKAELGTSG